jgi:hypothetical protein
MVALKKRLKLKWNNKCKILIWLFISCKKPIKSIF